MLSKAEVLLTATKEHTDEFKAAVLSRVAAGTDESVCYASVTKQFKEKGKPMWRTKLGDFNQALFDTQYDLIELSLPDESFAGPNRQLPYKDKGGSVDVQLLKTSLGQIKDIEASPEEKEKALRALLSAAQENGVDAIAELKEEFSPEFLNYADSDNTFTNVLSQEDSPPKQMTVELSGTIHSWKSLGHALQVTGELMRPGVYQGIDGKKCRWPKATLSKYYKTLLGTPTKLFHTKEGQFRSNLPVTRAGKTVGFITHLSEYMGRIFYRSLVFPKKAQKLVKQRKLQESLEALVSLSKPDVSGVPDVKAFIGLGLAYTDRPAVKGRRQPTTNPVALSRKNEMADPDPTTPGTTPPAEPAEPVAPDKVELSTSKLQELISSAVEKGTAELSTKVDELQSKLDNTDKELKELSNVRNDVRLAEIHSMEEDIKKHMPDFNPTMLYDPEKATLAVREERLDLFIRGINAGATVIGKKLPAITPSAPALYSEPVELAEETLDQECIKMFGKPFNQMLAAPVEAAPAVAAAPAPNGGST